MTQKSGMAVRGSSTGRPIMVLLDILGRKWALRILWELRDESLSFRALQEACGAISPTVLNARLRDLRDLGLIALGENGYGLTDAGKSLGSKLTELDIWANEWAAGD